MYWKPLCTDKYIHIMHVKQTMPMLFVFRCLQHPIGQSLKVTRTGDRLWIDADEALNRFKAWLKVVTGLPDYDHAMAFTGYVKYVG